MKLWRDTYKIPIYVGVGSADFLIMVLQNTNHGNILTYFHGHMNIMDFDGTKANKDFKKLAAILRLPQEKILYLTRFRQDCKRAMDSGLQSIILLRQDFDTHGLCSQMRARRGTLNSIDGTKTPRGYDETASPPARPNQNLDLKNPEIRKQYENNFSSLSLIDDHEDPQNLQSSTIVEQDLTRFNMVLSLSEIAFK